MIDLKNAAYRRPLEQGGGDDLDGQGHAYAHAGQQAQCGCCIGRAAAEPRAEEPAGAQTRPRRTGKGPA